MEYFILIVGVIAILGVLIYAAQSDKTRAEKIEKDLGHLKEDRVVALTKIKMLEDRSSECFTHIDNIFKSYRKWADDVEVLTVRQRSLEKKIISSERTINLVFGKPIPVQHEAVKGQGRKALIRPNV